MGVVAGGITVAIVLSACGGQSDAGGSDGGRGASGGSSGSSSGRAGAGGVAGSNVGGTLGSGTGGIAGSNAAGAPGSDTGGIAGSNVGGASGSLGPGGTSGSSSGGDEGFGGASTCQNVPVGTLCLRGTPSGENELLEVGERLRVEVRPGGCHSSSCTVAHVKSCTVSSSGTNLVATGEFCLSSIGGPGIGCTADCGGGEMAACESDEPLQAGEYTITLGTLSVPFSVPGTLRPGRACVGSQF